MRRIDSDLAGAPGGADLDAPSPADDVVRALVRAHGAAPPYEAVHWDALAARVVAAGRDEVETQRGRAAVGPAGARSARRTGVRAWWQVAAGWIGPAALAAAAIGGVAVMLASAATTGPLGTGEGDETVATSSGIDARSDWQITLGDRGTDATRNAASDATTPTSTNDSLYDAVVTQ